MSSVPQGPIFKQNHPGCVFYWGWGGEGKGLASFSALKIELLLTQRQETIS